MRSFLDERGFFEVDTPLLSHDQVIDANLEPLIVPRGWGGKDLFLQTSPEFAMKRLLVAGSGSIYQLGKVFRRGERGIRHNPEFTMLEWYETGTDHHDQMKLTEALVRSSVLDSPHLRLAQQPFVRTTYAQAFQEYLGAEIFQLNGHDLKQIAVEKQLQFPESLAPTDLDGWRNLLLAELIEPFLGKTHPEFLYDYPASQAALAVVRPGPPPVAERFELYIRGIEICNGYHELSDPFELQDRIRKEWTVRDGQPPLNSRLLQAMSIGLPKCAGVALGVDRLIMLVSGKETIDQVIPFPIETC